jgi:uncharacterized protein (TIGR00251 family)
VVATGGIKIEVSLTPRASRNEIVGMRDDVLRVRVTAPPVGGKANESLRKLIAKRLGVAKGRVTIVRGERGRHKLVSVEGLDQPPSPGTW